MSVQIKKPVTKRPAKRRVYNDKHIIGFFFTICLVLTIFLGTVLFGLVSLRIPDIKNVAHYQPMQTTYIFDRHVHSVSGGAMCRQSSWMRSKRLANHYGFHILEITINKMGVSRFKVEFFPFYQ